MRIIKSVAFVSSFLVGTMIFVGSCKKSDGLANVEHLTSSGYKTVTVQHYGFDFSAGVADTVNWANNDGETVGWQPGGANNPSYPSYDKYIWYRNSELDTVSYLNQTKDMGVIDITTVKNVPSQWDTVPYINPLLVGHVIVAKCRDGYVKFEVLSADTTMFWPAEIKYYFSSGSTFLE